MLILLFSLLGLVLASGASPFTEVNRNFIVTEVAKTVVLDKNTVLSATLEVLTKLTAMHKLSKTERSKSSSGQPNQNLSYATQNRKEYEALVDSFIIYKTIVK